MFLERRVRTGQRPLEREVLLTGQWDMELEWEAMRESSGGERWIPWARLDCGRCQISFARGRGLEFRRIEKFKATFHGRAESLTGDMSDL